MVTKTITKHKQGLMYSLKQFKRKDFNVLYDKKKADVIETVNVLDPKTGKMKAVTRIKLDAGINFDFTVYQDPDQVPLDKCVKYIVRGYGTDMTIHFKDDATTEEINKVTEILESEL